MKRTFSVRVMAAIGLALAALVFGSAARHGMSEPAAAASTTSRKVILIQGITSTSSCAGGEFLNTFGDVIAALKAQSYVPLTDADFLGLSYSPTADQYCGVTPGTNTGSSFQSTIPSTPALASRRPGRGYSS